MNVQTEILIAFVLYLIIFTWLGWRRGARAELIVLLASVFGWIVLQERGSIFVRLTNFAGKFITLVRAGGLTGDQDAALAALVKAPNIITEESTSAYLFLLWAILVVLAYMISGRKGISKNNKADGWAVIWGALNGLFFASVLLPRLATLLVPTATAVATATVPAIDAANEAPLRGFATVLESGFSFIWSNIEVLWGLTEANRSMAIVAAVTVVLALTAISLRTSGTKKSSS